MAGATEYFTGTKDVRDPRFSEPDMTKFMYKCEDLCNLHVCTVDEYEKSKLITQTETPKLVDIGYPACIGSYYSAA